VKPIGVGDLKIVKQRLARYEPGEVAHIENVLEGENRGREHRRLRQFEEIVTFEQEREEESRRDLQSTERFELQTESERTIRSETTLQAGLDLSISYGPVRLGAYGKFASTNAKEESDTNSTEYAKEITEKTTSRLMERRREERVTRTLEEVEEKNEHGFENDSGENITGVYRWVDKYYRSKVFNYGKRLMYEFYVPEPGAFILFATKYRYERDVLPVKPAEPVAPGTTRRLAPADLNRWNYLTLVSQYEAQGVEAPPPDYLLVSKPISRELRADHWAFSNEDLEIPGGYAADYGLYRVRYTWQSDPPRSGTIMVGTNGIDIDIYPPLWFNREIRSMPVSGNGYAISSFAINIEVMCTLTTAWFERWQLNTYNAIMNAYRKKLLDYEEKVAAAQIQQGVAIEGDNPAVNREVEREQLKKACLEIWTYSVFGSPPGIVHVPSLPVPDNYPEIHRGNAIANAARLEFLEEAFEWDNLIFELYPYFWGRRSNWLELWGAASTDPLFERFLSAGAARVVVPVKPSITEAVLYYQLTGVIWTGGPVPSLSTINDPDVPLYNGYLTDLEGVEDVIDIEEDVVIEPDDPDSWLVKVPTDLVWLQAGSALPDLEAD
jgi:hypothetical protein